MDEFESRSWPGGVVSVVGIDRQLPSPWLLWVHHEKSSDVGERSERKFTLRFFPIAAAHLTSIIVEEYRT
jgi:hypothetical protein